LTSFACFEDFPSASAAMVLGLRDLENKLLTVVPKIGMMGA
jgi:hypothetical protein